MILDRNRYSVPAEFAGRVVSARTTATQVRIVADRVVIAEHGRRFGRDLLVCDPWHYLVILERKPGALRNGVPFREWDLPVAIQQVRDRILKQPRGDRAFVELLLRVLPSWRRRITCSIASHITATSWRPGMIPSASSRGENNRK